MALVGDREKERRAAERECSGVLAVERQCKLRPDQLREAPRGKRRRIDAAPEPLEIGRQAVWIDRRRELVERRPHRRI
jgi:hypothetical protein